MKLEQTDNKLVVKEAPGCIWILGLFFIGVSGTIVYGSLGGFTNYREIPQWQVIVAFVMGSFGVMAGYGIIWAAPVTRLVIDKQHNILTHTRRGINGKTKKIYTLDQIKEFTLIDEADSDGDPIYFLGLELASGEKVKISSLSSHDESYKRDFLFKANTFLGKQLPSYGRDENGG